MTRRPSQGKLPEQGPGSVSNTEELENRPAGAAYAEPSVTGEVHKLQLYIADPPGLSKTAQVLRHCLRRPVLGPRLVKSRTRVPLPGTPQLTRPF